MDSPTLPNSPASGAPPARDGTRGALVGVGVGPGDPEHLTLKALSELRAADAVFAPTLDAAEEGRAEAIVRRAAPEVAVERLVFAVSAGRGAQSAAHAGAAAIVVDRLDAGGRVAFVTLGDPNIYSTFHHLAAAVVACRPGTEVRTVPGIMAFQDLAARSGTVVVDGNERLHLVSAVDGADVVDRALDDPGAAIVVYKGGRHLPEIADRLADAGRLDAAVWGELLGLPGERVGALAERRSEPAAYLACIVVPPERQGDPGGCRGEPPEKRTQSTEGRAGPPDRPADPPTWRTAP